MSFSLGDTVTIGAGNASADFTIVGTGYHPLHVLFAPEGELFPSEPGQYVVGYLSDAGMARLTGEVLGTSNMILLDVEGTPSFDLPDTSENEGDVIDEVKDLVDAALGEAALDARVRDRGQNEPVEVMRQDLEGTKRTTVPFTVMIASIAAITIVLSLQRLVQSQAKEIAVLRTLGVKRSSLMTGYLIAPLAIGGLGCALGALAGPSGMNGMLDFYQELVGVPIVERSVPTSVVASVIGSTMLVVFFSGAFPAWKASRLDPLAVLSGQNEMRVGSNLLRKLTSWMPTTLGLSIRSSVRKPDSPHDDFCGCRDLLMLFGSIQMMSAGLQETMVGGLEDDQTWDAQVYIMPEAEGPVVDWATDNSASYEMIIEMPLGSVADGDGIDRVFTLVGLDSFDEGMRSVSILDGDAPTSSAGLTQVMMDEGSMTFLGWSVGDQHTVTLNGADTEVEVTATSYGRISENNVFLTGRFERDFRRQCNLDLP